MVRKSQGWEPEAAEPVVSEVREAEHAEHWGSAHSPFPEACGPGMWRVLPTLNVFFLHQLSQY